MSTTDGAGAPEQDGRARVVQIYPRTSQETAVYCPLQVSRGDNARSVIHNAIVTLGLDSSQRYALLEVRERDGEEMPLKDGDVPLKRVLLWPTQAQRWHPQSQGHYFILQQQPAAIGGDQVSSTEDYDDLCNLPAVTEQSILEALRQRFYKFKIYTYARNILIAINPNKLLPVYYNPKYIKMYEKQPLGKLSPHIFAVADVAFRTMLSRQVNQCIVISGVIGSGKTESSSYLIHCLTALGQKTYSTGLERTILGAGPLLEAFGNARTAENNNSSRFGKFIQLHYLESGVIRGAVIEKYLLEKGRLVSRDKTERNYHVFYYLLVGASKDEREEFHLLKPQDYLYLKQVFLSLIDDEKKLVQEYKRLHQAMEMVGFLASTQKQIFSTLSAILHLGNVTYALSEDTQVLEVGPAEVLSTLSDLLKVKEEMLVTTLTKRRVVTTNATINYPYTLEEASKARDSMAKSLYSALFDWIVLHINLAMLNRRDMEDSVSCLSIGVLDMFGFENLHTNRFEQLCINYTNEKLQHYINQSIFKLKQEDYVSEGLTWQNIDYSDNGGVIELISQKSTGIFDLLHNEDDLPEATDETLMHQLKQQHHNNSLFVPSPNRKLTFAIQHFAGTVEYHIKDFRERNSEHMRPEVVSLLRSSERSFLHQLVASSPEALFRWGVLRATIRILSVFKNLGRQRADKTTRRTSRKSLKEIKQRNSAVDRLSSHSITLDFSFDRSDEHPLDVFEDIFTSYEMRKRSRGGRQKQLIPKKLMDFQSLHHIVGLTAHDRTSKSVFHPHPRARPLTVSAQLQASLRKLMETIEKAEPFFIFCLRSNTEKKELHFDEKLVLKQIRYIDMLQMVHIQKSGYSARYTFGEFVEKFRMLFPKGACGAPEHITELFEKMKLDKSTYQIGKTKVFLKEKERQLLQDTHNKEVMRRLIILQRWFRASLIRQHFLQKKDATLLIQRSWREFYENQNQAATVIQTAWRTSLKRKDEGTTRQGRDSMTKKEFKRQQKVEQSPNRAQKLDHGSNQSAPRDQSREKRDGRGSPPPLTRPHSCPLDPKVGGVDRSPSPSASSSLQRYTDMEGFKEKAEKWKERKSEGEPTDESSPETFRRNVQANRADDFHRKGKSKSVDELSNICSSGSDSSPTSSEVRVRLRKLPKRKRRLAYARSGLMANFGGSKESEYWSFPLPPLSPHINALQSSISSVDVRGYTSQVKISAEPDGSRFSLQPRTSNENSGQGSNQSQLTTPDKIWFLSRFLKRRVPKLSPSSDSPTVTLPRYTPHSYHMPSKNTDRNPTIKISRTTRSIEWNTSLDREISDTKELRHLDEFLGNQVNELRTRIKELSPTERIFLTATMQFRETIKGMYSLEKPQIAYKDLMKGYHNKVNTLAGPGEKAKVSLVVNLFQSVLDGFIRGERKREESEPLKAPKGTKKRRKKEKCLDSPLDHLFSTYQVNIMQSCDLCGSYIWGMEKAYMCSACKLICHKKCLDKIITDCSTRCARKDENLPGSLHFGVQVCVLTSKANPVPKVVEMLLLYVEINGLYTEGIYRKSGSAVRARELHQILETNPESACLENYPIHTITGLVKRWLRELPDPLLTYSLYSDFLHAAELPENDDRIRAVYQKVDELPPANHNTLERLIFHLVRVAKEEEHNKMTPTSLAIVFAPCILRSPDSDDPFLGMKDVSKTTQCVETLICEQFRRYNEKMQNIQELEYAEALAVNQLKLKRQNTVVENPSELNVPEAINTDETEMTLIERIKSIKQEKVDLACRLPDLEQENFDNDNLDSLSSMSSESLDDSHLGSLESEGRVTMRLKTPKPDCPVKPPDLAQRVRSLMAQTNEFTPGRGTGVTQSMIFLSSPDNPSANGSFEDLDIPYIDEDEELP
ncbi:unconventional myosin-IXb isoform X1 [Platichthys flesus]|uniref:unconventional myosin-IXb isoform X1 n=1 Tax=Platichthys flesus TaxID=8260 RepID=UPI002DB61325|nr:unconventional myosin-IXb isoform X1 [Platichthys flesus]